MVSIGPTYSTDKGSGPVKVVTSGRPDPPLDGIPLH